MRHRRNRRQRLAPESQRADSGQIVGVANLAGRMALEGQPRVLGRHALAIVFHADLLLAAQFGVNRQAAGARVDGVLVELLNERRRTLDDYDGNLIRETGRQAADLPHVELRYIHRFRRKYISMIAVMATESAASHQNCMRSPPGKCGSGTFMPYAPVSSINGRKTTDTIVN